MNLNRLPVARYMRIEIRDAHGKSDYRVAKETGIAQSTMSDWKSGKSTPKVDKLLKIAECLDVSLEQIVGRVADGD